MKHTLLTRPAAIEDLEELLKERVEETSLRISRRGERIEVRSKLRPLI